MLGHRSSRIGPSGLMLLGATVVTWACGASQLTHQDVPQAVLAAPSPTQLLSWITSEVQDTLAAALPEGACVTTTTPAQDPNVVLADRLQGSEPAPTQSWRYEGCGMGRPGMSLSGERHLWVAQSAAAGAKVRSRFAFTRSRADGAHWLALGQTEALSPQGVAQATEQRVLSHGSVTPSGIGTQRASDHAYAYHLRTTEGLDGAATRRLSGVAQLNFATVETTSQVKLAALIWAPGCPWPVYGRVDVATTASDGSFIDAALTFTELCGVVTDDQGALTTLAMPWDEGA